MKKALAALLVLVLCVGLCACDQDSGTTATVTLSDGGTKTVTSADVRSNSFKYEDAQITVSGEVEKIAQDAFGWTYVVIKGGWKVIVEEDAVTDADIDVGSVIFIGGHIYDADKNPVVIKYATTEGNYVPVSTISKLFRF